MDFEEWYAKVVQLATERDIQKSIDSRDGIEQYFKDGEAPEEYINQVCRVFGMEETA